MELFFLSLPSADMAVERVAERVRQGGHNVPEQVIRRRFMSGMKNFIDVYQALVNEWALYDNAAKQARVVAQQTGTALIVSRAGKTVRLMPKPDK